MSLSALIFIVIAVCVHEFAHAWVADRLGDPTPRLLGRLTLNPLAHLDPLGTLALIFFRFGWGKPVPIDPFNFRSPRRDQALVALAGPASNFILAALAGLIFHLLGFFAPTASWFPPAVNFLFHFAFLNAALGLFNLLPLHPLDGGKIITGFLPPQLATSLGDVLEEYTLPLILILLLPLFSGRSLIEILLVPLARSLSLFLFQPTV